MKKKLFIIGISFLFLFGAFFAHAEFTSSQWQFFKPISLPSGVSQDTLVSVELDEEVLTKSADNLADLRVIEGAKNEVPFVMRSLEAKSQVRSFSPRMLNLSSVPGENTSLIADFGDLSEPHNSITILVSPLEKNFRRNAKVEGANTLDDESAWRVLKNNESIYDYSLEFHVQDTTITYPDSTFRYLRITITDAGETPLRVTGLRGERAIHKSGRVVIYEPSRAVSEVDKTTEVLADLGKRGIFTNRALFTIDARNFERGIQVFASDTKEQWRFIGSDTVYHYATPSFSGSKFSVSYAETDARYLRFVISNADSPPLTITDFSLEGLVRAVSFLASEGKSYALYYGSPLAKSPRYDFERIYQFFSDQTPLSASLGTEEENTIFTIPLSERFPWLFPVVLGLVVLILGLVVFNLVRRTRQYTMPPHDNPNP